MQPGDVVCAFRTLYEEVVEFSFDYPLVAVHEAAQSDSLHYYLYKYSRTPPFRQALRLDSHGIAMAWGRTTGTVYRPAFVAMCGLGQLGKYLRTGDPECKEIFLNHIDWLEQHAVIRPDGGVVWPQNFNLREGNIELRAPWLSANVQGYVMSALVRGWRMTRRQRLLDLLQRTTRVFELDWNRNGVRVQSEGHVVYTETPGLPAPGVMDGLLTSLLGLYDLYVETGDAGAYDLFQRGIDGLKYFLPRWDYRKKWSMYGNRFYLSPPSYHCQHRLLLGVLACLTGEPSFMNYAEAWNHERLSAADRVEIYLGFVLTKNAFRFRHRTWRLKPAEVRDF